MGKKQDAIRKKYFIFEIQITINHLTGSAICNQVSKNEFSEPAFYSVHHVRANTVMIAKTNENNFNMYPDKNKITQPVIYLFFLFLVLNYACGQSSAKIQSDVISEEENKTNTKLLRDALKNAASNPVNNTIIYGYSITMNDSEFEAHTKKIISTNELKTSGRPEFKGEYLFEFEDGTTQVVGIHPSRNAKYPKITIKTFSNNTDLKTSEELRNKFIDWAIKKYGPTYYITLNHSYADNTTAPTNNYTWICGSYKLDIVIGGFEVALTYSLL